MILSFVVMVCFLLVGRQMFSMKSISYLLVVFGASICTLTFANTNSTYSYPAEFADFFVKKIGVVNLVVAGEGKEISVNAAFNYDGVNIVANADSITLINEYLGRYIKESAVDEVVNSLIDGVSANPGCATSISACVPNVLPGQVLYTFDFDAKLLKVFVGSLLVSTSSDKEYLPSFRSSNGLVNNSSFYAQVYSESPSSFNLSNKTTLGLPVGYVELDTQVRNSGDSFDVYSAVYDVEFDNKRVVLGYMDRTGKSFNATDVLNNNADYSSFNIRFGSSHNLLKGGAKGAQRVFFIAPQDGQLEVYLDKRLLLSRPVSSGRQSISYSELPQGAYTINLKLLSGGVNVMDDVAQIVNNSEFVQPVGDIDYAFSVGVFDRNYNHADKNFPGNYSGSNFKKSYVQARSAWRFAESAILYGGITTNSDDHYTQLGAKYIYNNLFSSDYFFGYFSNGDLYQSASINFGRLSLSAKYFDKGNANGDFTLSNQLYGERGYKSFSVNYSQKLLGGSAYLNFNHYDAKYSSFSKGYDTLNHNRFDDLDGFDYLGGQQSINKTSFDNFNVGWSINVYNGSLTLNSGYNVNGDYNDLKFGIYWSQRFGKRFNSTISLLTSNKGVSQYNTSISSSFNDDNWSTNFTAMAGLNDDGSVQSSLSGTYYWYNDKVNVDGYTFVNDKGLLMSSGTLKSTQVLTAKSISLTRHNGNAFAGVSLESDTPISKMRYNLHSSKHTKSGYVSNSNETIIPIRSYDEVLFSLDSSSKVEVSSDSKEQFVYPGTVIRINNQITSLDSQVFVVSDIAGKPVTHIRCLGEGCRDIEPLSNDGVFRVNFKKGGFIALTSEGRSCVFDQELNGQKFIHATCIDDSSQESDTLVMPQKNTKASH